jgi:lambda family phage tail tape measure protein
MAESQIRVIKVKVDTQGDRSLKTIAKGFSDVNRNVRQSTSVISSFKNAFLAIQGLSFAGIGVREIVQAADSMQKLNDRLNITEGSIAGANARLRQLTAVANNNYTAIDDVAGIYARLSQALGDSGISSQKLISLTDTLQKSFRLSGATAAEATAAQVQLSQGLSSGQLRGQELRSVLEANVVIGDKLAKQFGITRGEILKFSEKRGGITTPEFFQAIAKGAADINAQAEKLRPTIREGLTKNFNDLKVRLDDLNKEFAITEKLVKAIDIAFKNLDLVAAATAVAGLYKAFSLLAAGLSAVYAKAAIFGAFIAGSAFYQSIVTAGVAVASFVVSIASLPLAITAAVTGLVLAFSTIKDFRDAIVSAGEAVFDFITYGSKYKDFNPKLREQKKAAEELAIAQKQLTRSYVLLDNGMSDTEKSFKQMFDTAASGKAVLGPIEALFASTTETIDNGKAKVLDFKTALGILNTKFLEKKITLADYNKELKAISIQDLEKDFKEGSITLEQYNKRLQEINFGKIKTNTKDYQAAVRELNREFSDLQNIKGYSDELAKLDIEKLNADLKGGIISLNQYNDTLNTKKIEAYNREVAAGVINFTQFDQAINALKIEDLNQKFASGQMDVYKYNEELIKLEEKFNPGGALATGLNNYIQSAGTLSQGIANVVTQTFGNLEKALFDFTKTGKFNFNDFAAAVLDDLNRIILRAMIIRPLAQGLLGGMSDLGEAQAVGAGFAKGGAFNSTGVQAFATGGVVSSPTMFNYGGTKTGIMGEAGPEAILPLKRDSQGNLGVTAAPSNVVVNVINNAGVETEQRESTGPNGDKIIDVIILNKVKEGFAAGAFDRQLSQQYGLRRRGT